MVYLYFRGIPLGPILEVSLFLLAFVCSRNLDKPAFLDALRTNKSYQPGAIVGDSWVNSMMIRFEINLTGGGNSNRNVLGVLGSRSGPGLIGYLCST